MTSPPKPRWLQFSLRGLLLATLCAACYFGGWKSNEWRNSGALDNRQRAALELQILESEHALLVAEQKLQSSQRLQSAGYVTALQVQTDQMQVDYASKRLDELKSQLGAQGGKAAN